MRIDEAARWLAPLAMVVFAWSGGMGDASAEEAIVSVVTDGSPGPAASHGMEKLKAALRAKGFTCEKAASLEDPKQR
jgi:hypothetical protein